MKVYFYAISFLSYENNIINVIINANNASASINEKLNIANENKFALKLGFLATPEINAANTNPAPTPDPTTPIVANPAPMYLPAVTITVIHLI